ncbi:hypothetical protein FA95DRAFT_1613623 [Auriscalpium vulgare]|uniref:Uncharacterized protein n=1 Tax=Auriscalpium vulgare TaxID=40419 RepID=A0ACB8R2Z7_9AGAM|nr:hypothetical protein FA95DRAFT_1613623 [Auriscalpium vulgare]
MHPLARAPPTQLGSNQATSARANPGAAHTGEWVDEEQAMALQGHLGTLAATHGVSFLARDPPAPLRASTAPTDLVRPSRNRASPLRTVPVVVRGDVDVELAVPAGHGVSIERRDSWLAIAAQPLSGGVGVGVELAVPAAHGVSIEPRGDAVIIAARAARRATGDARARGDDGAARQGGDAERGNGTVRAGSGAAGVVGRAARGGGHAGEAARPPGGDVGAGANGGVLLGGAAGRGGGGAARGSSDTNGGGGVGTRPTGGARVAASPMGAAALQRNRHDRAARQPEGVECEGE